MCWIHESELLSDFFQVDCPNLLPTGLLQVVCQQWSLFLIKFASR